MRELLARQDPWVVLPQIEELKAIAKRRDCGTCSCPTPSLGRACRTWSTRPWPSAMGRSLIAPEVCNCNAPDTGNMEVLWHFGSERAEAALAEAAARRGDPLGLLHDRARGGLLGCHQHAGDRRARRRRGRAQRAQVVEHRRRPSRTAGRRSSWASPTPSRPLPPALDGARADGRARGEGRADARGDGLPRRARRPRRSVLHRRAPASRARSSAGPGRPSRSLRRASGPGASTTACA